MNGLPLHPAIVHVPLGLSVVLPLLAIAFAWALWRGRIGRGVWATLVGLQAVIVVAGLVALRSGHEAAHQVRGQVPRAAIHTHEERAEAFEWLAGATLVLAVGVLVVPGRARNVLGALTAAATVAVAGAGRLRGRGRRAPGVPVRRPQGLRDPRQRPGPGPRRRRGRGDPPASGHAEGARHPPVGAGCGRGHGLARTVASRAASSVAAGGRRL